MNPRTIRMIIVLLILALGLLVLQFRQPAADGEGMVWAPAIALLAVAAALLGRRAHGKAAEGADAPGGRPVLPLALRLGLAGATLALAAFLWLWQTRTPPSGQPAASQVVEGQSGDPMVWIILASSSPFPWGWSWSAG
jgi:hypothetical protein